VLEEEKYETEKFKTKRKENYKILEARMKVLIGEETNVIKQQKILLLTN